MILLLIITFFSSSLFGGELTKVPPKPPEPIPISDIQARQVRELQIAVMQAVIDKNEAEKQYQRAVDNAQSALQSKVASLQKELHCEGCGLSKDLKWEPTAKPK